MAGRETNNHGAFQLDPAILAVLREDETVVGVEPYGTSVWASTARINVVRGDGSPRAYFLKLISAEDAAERVLGEYLAMREIHSTLPSIAPEPHGHGKCEKQPSHYFICDYLSLTPGLPDPVRLGKKLAQLHSTSVSPTGMFGFHCTTFDGKLPLTTTWDPSWTSFFRKLMGHVYRLDVKVNGFWRQLDDVMQITLDKLIPRLLDPLTAEGRSIKPSLIHGDLWESNIGTDVSGDIYIYDACSYYAHHEKELGIWRVEHHEMKDEVYRNEYFKNYKPSEPVAEFDDRNRLYAVETLLIYSAHFPGSEARHQAVHELRHLIDRYSCGFN